MCSLYVGGLANVLLQKCTKVKSVLLVEVKLQECKTKEIRV